jgi:crotonobetainyl-CoA:carnitine CoA-transferase CaiB-like acyl-CoA transferase
MTRPPLEGLRVLTVSQFGAGPFGTQVLADLGAEVIKIEDPAVGGDVARYVPPWEIEGDSLYFQSFNRGKKSVTLDLAHPDGRAVFHDLVRVSQAVYNNVRGDLPAKLGLTYETLKAVNPAVVCCSLSGFGSTGPRAGDPGYDYLIQGYAGYMAITGEPGGPPGKCGVSVIDFAGGYASMLALMIGLWDAQRTGIGRDVEISLLDTAVSMLSYFATWTLNRDWEPLRVADSGHQTLVPSQNFRTRDGWIVVFCAKEKFWEALADATDLGALKADPRFATFADRRRHKDALLAVLGPRFRERTTADWLARLRGRVPCAPVNTVREALEDEQVRARGMIVEVDHPEYGTIREVASPVRTAGASARPAPAPRLGEHTEALLRDVLRYPETRIAALRTSGALGRPVLPAEERRYPVTMNPPDVEEDRP